MTAPEPPSGKAELFDSAEWYDISINWPARMQREIPLLCETFGPPNEHGLLDAACATGRHIEALTAEGYRVTGLDLSHGMLDVARKRLAESHTDARLIEAPFDKLPNDAGPFDGLYCLGNSLASVGDPDAIRRSIHRLAAALVPGGRFFSQTLNFEKLRREWPRVRGPRVVHKDGRDYLSSRLFSFEGPRVEVTSITFWHDGETWRQYAGGGRLYALSKDELVEYSREAGLIVDALYGDYEKTPFAPATANDIILVATKKP